MRKSSVGSFHAEYNQMLFASIGNYYGDNFDTRRFGSEYRADLSSIRIAVSGIFSRLLAKGGLVRTKAELRLLKGGICLVQPYLADLEWLYQHLEDDESRKLLIQLIAYRALGHRKIKLPLNCPEHWERVRSAEKMAEGRESIPSGFMHFDLAKVNLRSIGYPIEMFLAPAVIVPTFIEQQYRCLKSGGAVACANGEVAIDAGACWGDTALYLAHMVGNHGKVLSFEFLPDNVKFFEMNLNLNPELASRIRLYKNPVWSASGEELFVSGHGPGTSVSSTAKDPKALKVQTLSIDDLGRRGEFERVDFIKMDIEGSEMAALQGAEQTLRRFKPKLAITVYHDLKDFWTIPQYLNQLGLGYSFYLRHFSTHAEETVLFAEAL